MKKEGGEFKINRAEFITSLVDDVPILHDGKKQVAFIGRSNVGKSSLMNMLMERKDLVKSSGTPGKTRTVNFFLVNDEFYLVDLPGYGYAKLSRVERDKLRDLITWYLSETPQENRSVVLVVDAKAGVTDLDLQMFDFLQQEAVSFLLAVNKVDKLNQKDLHALKKKLEDLLPNEQKIVHVSAHKKRGRRDLFDLVL